jgi:hypothetical protein
MYTVLVEIDHDAPHTILALQEVEQKPTVDQVVCFHGTGDRTVPRVGDPTTVKHWRKWVERTPRQLELFDLYFNE